MDIVERLRQSDNDSEWVMPLGSGEPSQQPTLAWQAAHEIEWLREQLLEVVHDAGRYRWLCGQMFRNDTGHLDLGGEIACNWHDPNKGEIDRAIDAAMKQTHNS